MDPITAAVTAYKIPVGHELNAAMNALKDGSGTFFDTVSDVLSFLIDRTSDALGAVPPLLFCVADRGVSLMRSAAPGRSRSSPSWRCSSFSTRATGRIRSSHW